MDGWRAAYHVLELRGEGEVLRDDVETELCFVDGYAHGVGVLRGVLRTEED